MVKDDGAVGQLEFESGLLGGGLGSSIRRKGFFQVGAASLVETNVQVEIADIDFAQMRVWAQQRKIMRME